ncbi:autotransporter, partial [Campylobacter sp. US18a]
MKKNHSSSKKLVLSLVTISFLSSYSYANNNTTISTSKTNTHTVNGTNNTLTITNSGTIQVSRRNQAVNFQNGSSTTTFLNQGTLIGG